MQQPMHKAVCPLMLFAVSISHARLSLAHSFPPSQSMNNGAMITQSTDHHSMFASSRVIILSIEFGPLFTRPQPSSSSSSVSAVLKYDVAERTGTKYPSIDLLLSLYSIDKHLTTVFKFTFGYRFFFFFS